MKLNALPLSLCRVPAFGTYDELPIAWPILKAKIKTASPSFYEQIAEVEANEIDTLPEKIKFTIWKYFNRAKYRATPFANFASYSVVPVSREPERLQIEAQMQSHQFINWEVKELLNSNLKTILRTASCLYSNTSAYQVDGEIRYLRLNEGTFELASVEAFVELTSIIDYCSIKRNKFAIYTFMKTEHELDESRCKNLILQLISLQLLHTNLTANITGEDYFTRLKLSLNNDEHYILAERKLLGGCLDKAKSETIAEALEFLSQLLPKTENSALQNFKNSFLKKFEHQEISLAVAMDPELGIGYGNLAQYEQADELIEQLKNASNKEPVSRSIEYTAMHQFLINSLMENEAIALDKLALTNTKPYPVPNTLSVLCHFYHNNPAIVHAGGCTANALLGRFTLANPTLEVYCKEIAKLEQNANSDVLFFDIPYQAETHIDNVNRRKSCYTHELPILTWSCQTDPLDFNDVMVAVQGDEIILFSKKLGKRLVPRLASAYNYSRSDLAVYRFLCDLQHQFIQSNLTFNIQTYLPGLKHYPRVSYKSVILSPAQWLLPKVIYQQKDHSLSEKLANLSLWLKQKNINFLIKTGVADQTLCFNPNISTDLIALLHYCKQQGDRPLYLSEALIDDEESVMDEHGNKYCAEFVINYHHKEQLYPHIQAKELSVTKSPALQTEFPIGSEWLYLALFIHPSKSNSLLSNEIMEFLKVHKSEITQWFFIRYDENGKHIRLRLRLKAAVNMQIILSRLNDLLAHAKANGIVTQVLLKPYFREIARYGSSRIVLVEQFFYLDSKAVLLLLNKEYAKLYLYQHTIQFMTKLTEICFPLGTDRLLFVKYMAEIFSSEFKINQKGFKKINQSYATFKKSERIFFNLYDRGMNPLEKLAKSIFISCAESEKSKMLADLIHMHVNRVFINYQRLHEAICYQFLYKQLLTERSRGVAEAERQFSA